MTETKRLVVLFVAATVILFVAALIGLWWGSLS